MALSKSFQDEILYISQITLERWKCKSLYSTTRFVVIGRKPSEEVMDAPDPEYLEANEFMKKWMIDARLFASDQIKDIRIQLYNFQLEMTVNLYYV